jgi:hypothetical protein
MTFGKIEPPRPFDEEPTIIIFDRNDYIADPRIDLKPFNTIVLIINDENILRTRVENFNKSFAIASILPQWNHIQTQGFVQHNLIGYPRVRLIYLFYINVDRNNMRALCGNRIIGCSPITSRIPAQTRHICAKTNDLNISYCEHHRSLNEKRDDIGVANLYAMQKDARLDLQLAYNEQIRRKLEEQVFG